MSDTGGDVSEHDAEVYHRNIFEEPDEDPATELVSVVAELKGVEHDQLNPLYSWTDDMISALYSSPPPAEAQAIVEFTYGGYRVTLYQDGHAVLMRRSTSE